MRLAKLYLEKFAGAPDGACSFLHPITQKPHPVTLITGSPASGKTSILYAIAAVKELVGGYGPPPDPARLRRRGGSTGKIAATWLLSPEEAAAAGVSGPSLVTEVSLDDGPAPLFDPGIRALFSAFTPDPAKGKFELFPAHRRLPPGPGPLRPPPSDLTAKQLRLSRDPAKYAGVRQAIIELAVGDAMGAAEQLDARGVVARWEKPDSLAAIKRSLASLAPWLRLAGVSPRGSAYEVVFVRSDGSEVELEELSETEQQALLFSVVFDRLGLNRSIVLVDQPELFIHPRDRARFLSAIEGLGSDNQIIAAVTSEELLTSAQPEQIVRIGLNMER